MAELVDPSGGEGNGCHAFMPTTFSSFRFTSYGFDEQTGVITLDYALDDRIHFVERFRLPAPPHPLSSPARHALDRLLWLLHLVAGVSYFKTAVPPNMVIETRPLPDDVASFLTRLYREGLAEFAWNNRLDLSAVEFPSGADAPEDDAPRAGLAPGAIVPIGGGKDSVVTIETLRRITEPSILFSIGDALPITRTASAAQLPHLVVTRDMSGNLRDLNAVGAYNGHVPVTAIVSLVACAVALVECRRDVVMSNERSASVGSDLGDGMVVNHQYSKGLAFETGLRDVLHRHVAADLEYFSLLRPFSELSIARAFAQMPRYWHAITSCNRAFRIDRNRRALGWCGECHKCRFVFLALAPFMTRADLVDILGRNLLDDPEQFDGYRMLLGMDGAKPFECVGELEESRLAMVMLQDSPEWASCHVVRRFGAEASTWGVVNHRTTDGIFAPSHEHHVPASYLGALDEILGT